MCDRAREPHWDFSLRSGPAVLSWSLLVIHLLTFGNDKGHWFKRVARVKFLWIPTEIQLGVLARAPFGHHFIWCQKVNALKYYSVYCLTLDLGCLTLCISFLIYFSSSGSTQAVRKRLNMKDPFKQKTVFWGSSNENQNTLSTGESLFVQRFVIL